MLESEVEENGVENDMGSEEGGLLGGHGCMQTARHAGVASYLTFYAMELCCLFGASQNARDCQ